MAIQPRAVDPSAVRPSAVRPSAVHRAAIRPASARWALALTAVAYFFDAGFRPALATASGLAPLGAACALAIGRHQVSEAAPAKAATARPEAAAAITANT
jgi:hypothetical protein